MNTRKAIQNKQINICLSANLKSKQQIRMNYDRKELMTSFSCFNRLQLTDSIHMQNGNSINIIINNKKNLAAFVPWKICMLNSIRYYLLKSILICKYQIVLRTTIICYSK